MLPLLGFVLLGLGGKGLFKNFAGILGTVFMLAAAGMALTVAYQYFFVSGKIGEVYQASIPFTIRWLPFANGLSIDLGVLLDPISVMMLVVVTLVSLMVHVYSLGYMHGEERYPTYFAYLSLFTFSMLGLVLSTNLFQIYIFWELVGLSSFLLIGFYYQQSSALAAAKKAFIVTRFADLGFLIGILVLSFYGQSLDLLTLTQRLTSTDSLEFTTATTATFLGCSALTWGLLLVFMGGAGKSAMFPLHIWLPDAMEGPTPVSALIHAATMVVAGVYLVARLFPVYAAAPETLTVITYVGVISSLFAAVIACTQTDIKRVLAYSTMSQIGYMMFSLGMSKYGGTAGLGFMASMFHLFTHAFFKSLLFLGAGSVIHLVHSNQMKDMGGLRKLMPVTHIAFLIACLAIAGVPPFSGFFSKEEILAAAWQESQWVYGVALFTAALTSFYMFRLYFSIFWNKEAAVQGAHHGEGTWTMQLPLLFLALCTVGAGFIGFPEYVTSDGRGIETHMEWASLILPVSLSIGSILVAAVMYKNANQKPELVAAAFRGFYRAAYRKFYIDEVYLFVTQKIIFPWVARPAAWFDKHIVDELVNTTGSSTEWISERIKKVQSGKVQQYALYFLAGLILIGLFALYLWKP